MGVGHRIERGVWFFLKKILLLKNNLVVRWTGQGKCGALAAI